MPQINEAILPCCVASTDYNLLTLNPMLFRGQP